MTVTEFEPGEPPSDEFRELQHRANQGSPEAIGELIRRYSEPLQRAVRRRLNQGIRRDYDSADFVQSAWGAFFTGGAERDFQDSGHFVAFVSRIAINKVYKAIHKRGRSPEGAGEISVRPRGDGHAGFEPSASDPTPSQEVIGDEALDLILHAAKEKDRQIILLLIAGHKQVEIAEMLGVSTARVCRAKQYVWERFDGRI